MHLPLQSRLKAFSGSMVYMHRLIVSVFQAYASVVQRKLEHKTYKIK